MYRRATGHFARGGRTRGSGGLSNDGNDDDDDRLEAGKRKRDAIRHAMI